MKKCEIKQNAKDQLISLLSNTDTIYTVLRNKSKGGLIKEISFFVIKDGDVHYINHDIANLLGYKFNKFFNGLVIKWNDIDAGFHVVHTLIRELGNGITVRHKWI